MCADAGLKGTTLFLFCDGGTSVLFLFPSIPSTELCVVFPQAGRAAADFLLRWRSRQLALLHWHSHQSLVWIRMPLLLSCLSAKL